VAACCGLAVTSDKHRAMNMRTEEVTTASPCKNVNISLVKLWMSHSAPEIPICMSWAFNSWISSGHL